MFTDKNLVLCPAVNGGVSFSGNGGSSEIGNVIDMGGASDFHGEFEVANKLLGSGRPMGLRVVLTRAVTGGTSIAIGLITGEALNGSNIDDRTPSNSGRRVASMVTTGPILRAEAAKGAVFQTYLPFLTYRPYYRYIQITVARTGNVTAGALSAALLFDLPHWEAAVKGAPVRLT